MGASYLFVTLVFASGEYTDATLLAQCLVDGTRLGQCSGRRCHTKPCCEFGRHGTGGSMSLSLSILAAINEWNAGGSVAYSKSGRNMSHSLANSSGAWYVTPLR